MKYYKLIKENQIIGVITSNDFVVYSPITDCYLGASDLNGEYACYGNKLYRSTWMQPLTQVEDYEEVLIINITKDEYDVFKAAIKAEQEINNNKTQEEIEEEELEREINQPIEYIESITLDFIRTRKLSEMSYECRKAIENGIDIEVKGEKRHFSFTTQDQLNLMSLSTIAQTSDIIPYHADGEQCIYYTAAEINTIIAAMNNHKIYHTTYYNALKAYINSLETIEEISAIAYGTPIPDEYKTEVLKVIGQ